MSQTSETSTNPTITLQNLNKILIGVILAQSRGAYSFDESADLALSVKSISEFIRFYSTNISDENDIKKKLEQLEQLDQVETLDTQSTTVL